MLKTIRTFALHTPSLCVGLVFMMTSILSGGWLTRLPEVKSTLGLTESQLGFALLGLPIGALSITLLSGRILSGISSGRSSVWSLLCVSAAITLPAYAYNFWTLIGAFILMGLSNGILNISMNATAASIEDKFHVRIMSSCHGMFSFGGMIGAGLGGIFAMLEVPIAIHLTSMSVLILMILLIIRPTLWSLPFEKAKASSLTLPPKAVLHLVVIGFGSMIGEGAVANWGAIFLKESLGTTVLVASLGFALYSLAMAIGRFSGDHLRVVWSSKTLLTNGCLLGGIGLVIVVSFSTPWIALIGFILTGLGFSVVVPILFSLAAKTPGVDPSHGIAAVATSGIIGFLLGPPLIGYLAESLSLSVGLLFVAGLSLISATVAKLKT